MSPVRVPFPGAGPDPSFAGLSVLIVGLGSVGYRHLKNLVRLGLRDIVLLRTGSGCRQPDSRLGFPVETDLSRALNRGPTAVIISSPTAYHMDTALAAGEAGCHLFLEKPVSHSWKGIPELDRLVRERSLVAVTGFQFRFHPLLRTVKRWLEEGRLGTVIAARAEYGEYLPSWHPSEDYRRGYSARAGLGGGPVLTLSHPFDYLRWLLGGVRSVAGATARLSHLEIDTEDVAHTMLRFACGAIGAVELDYIQHPKRHALQIVGEAGTMRLDFEAGSVYIAPADGGQPLAAFTPPEFERNSMFLDEMQNFLSALIGSESPACTLTDGIRALEISLAAHRSSEERREIDVEIPL